MKQLTPLILSLLVVGSTVACGKGTDSTSNSSQSQTAIASVPEGTKFEVTVPAEISTSKNKDQDRFILPVKTPLLGGNAILKGSKVAAHLEDVVKAERGKKASLHLVFDEITLKDGAVQPLDVKLLDTKLETKTKGQFLKNAGLIVGGAVAGKFIGDKAKQKHGGLMGAAAATAFVLASPGGEVVLKKGAELDLQLKSPIELAKAGS